MSNLNHGHETHEHRQGKVRIAEWFKRLGAVLVLFEYRLCDVLAAFKQGTVGAEFERCSKHALINVKKDIANGCDLILSVCADTLTKSRVIHELDARLPACERSRVLVTTLGELETLDLTNLTQLLNAACRQEGA